MEIVLDFDGTVVAHDYPRIGADIGAVPILKKMQEKLECRFILFTMRSGAKLDEAVQWFKDNGIPLYGVQKNPTQDAWTGSPKAYGQLIIDDAALGAPLKTDKNISNRPFIDWERVNGMIFNE
jgi:hypothetical protein